MRARREQCGKCDLATVSRLVYPAINCLAKVSISDRGVVTDEFDPHQHVGAGFVVTKDIPFPQIDHFFSCCFCQ